MHSRDEFLEQLREARLLNADEIGDVLARVNEAPDCSDAKGIAGVFVSRGLLTAYQVQALFRGQGRNLALGNYIILDELGEGGMGMVYRARHQNMKREVALKVVSEQISKSEKTMRRFHREVEASAKLNHPNIVTAYDAAEDRGIWYLVMELVDGDDLSSIVKQNGPLTVTQAVELILQAAAGSQYAHEQGVIHRDIKPSNLLLDRSGTVKILDMGLARIQAEQEGLAGATKAELTHTGVVMGTVDYMAPEQAVNTKDADARSDIYSLGCTLWYLLTGQPLYKGDSMMNILLAHRDQPVPSLNEIRNDVSPDLQEIFERMVAKSPDARYQAMSDVISDLQAFPSGDAELTSLLPAIRSEESRIDSFLAGLSDDAITPTNVVAAGTQNMPSSGGPTHVADWRDEKTEQQPTHLSHERPTTPEHQPSGGSNRRRVLAIAGGLAGLLLLLLILLPDLMAPSDSPENHGDGNSPAVTFDELDVMPLFEDTEPDGRVHLSAPVGSARFRRNRIELPYSYRLELKLLRKAPPDPERPTAGATHFQFKVGHQSVQYYLDYGGNNDSFDKPVSGFVRFNQKPLLKRRDDTDSEVGQGYWLRDGVFDTVVFEVHSVPERNFGRIVLNINGEEKSRWQGSLANFELQSDRFPNQQPWDLIVGQWHGELTIQSARVTRLEPPEAAPPELVPSPQLIDITDRFTFYNPKTEDIKIRLNSGGAGPQTNYPVADNYRFEFALEREGNPSVTHFYFKMADHIPFIAVDYRPRPNSFYTAVDKSEGRGLKDKTRTDVVRQRLLKEGVVEHLAFDIHSKTPSGDAEIILRLNGVEKYRWQGDPQQFADKVLPTIHMVHWGKSATVKNIYYMPLPD